MLSLSISLGYTNKPKSIPNKAKYYYNRFLNKLSLAMIVLIWPCFILPVVPDSFLDVPDGFLDVPDGFLDVPDGFLDVPDGVLDVPGGFLDVPGGFLDVP